MIIIYDRKTFIVQATGLEGWKHEHSRLGEIGKWIQLNKKKAVGMGEICKWIQLNTKKWYWVVQDLSFYEMRWILKFSLKHRLMNEIDIFNLA